MRHLLIEEVEKAGHKPHLVYGKEVYSFRHSMSGQVVGYGSDAYSTLLILSEMDLGHPAPVSMKVRT